MPSIRRQRTDSRRFHDAPVFEALAGTGKRSGQIRIENIRIILEHKHLAVRMVNMFKQPRG